VWYCWVLREVMLPYFFIFLLFLCWDLHI
jgi:hypothetical protein